MIGENIPQGTYSYTAYDTADTEIVEGLFTLFFRDSISFEGEWKTRAIGDPQYVGPQIGDGNLIGAIYEDNRIWVNLNPGWKDDNVHLRGIYSANRMNGSWIFSTYTGLTNHGTFNAVWLRP